MKRELSQIFYIKAIDVNIPGSGSDGFRKLSSAIPMELSEEAKSSSHGILYKQSLQAYLDRGDIPASLSRISRFRAIVRLSDCEGDYTWGAVDLPVKVTVSPQFSRLLLTMECDSTRSIVRY